MTNHPTPAAEYEAWLDDPNREVCWTDSNGKKVGHRFNIVKEGVYRCHVCKTTAPRLAAGVSEGVVPDALVRKLRVNGSPDQSGYPGCPLCPKAADALEQANLKVAKLQAELDASLRENANLKTMNQEGGDHLANATDDCISEMRRANRAEQQLEKIRELAEYDWADPEANDVADQLKKILRGDTGD